MLGCVTICYCGCMCVLCRLCICYTALRLCVTIYCMLVFTVIDLLRMIILHPDGASVLFKHVNAGNDGIFFLTSYCFWCMYEYMFIINHNKMPMKIIFKNCPVNQKFYSCSFYDGVIKSSMKIVPNFKDK